MKIGGNGAIITGILIFVIDVLMFINTAFYEKGVLVTDRKQIFINYFDKRFFKDIFSNIPLLYNMFNSHEFDGEFWSP